MDQYNTEEPNHGGPTSDADRETPHARNEQSTRRQWLALTATIGGIGLAGCLGDGGDDGNGGQNGNDNTTGNGDPNDNNTTGNGDPNGGNGDPNGGNGDPNGGNGDPPGQETLDAVVADLGRVHEGIENVVGVIEDTIQRTDTAEVNPDEIASIIADEQERISGAEEELSGIDSSAIQAQVDAARDVIALQSEFFSAAQQAVAVFEQLQDSQSQLEQEQFMDAAEAWDEAGNKMDMLLDAFQSLEDTRGGLDTEFDPPLDYSEPIIDEETISELEASSLFINGGAGFFELLGLQQQGIERIFPDGEFDPDADFAAAREDFQMSANAGGTASETLAEALDTGNLSDDQRQQAGEWRQSISNLNEVNRQFTEGVQAALEGDFETAETVLTAAFEAVSQNS